MRQWCTCDELVKVHFNEFVWRRGKTMANTGIVGLYFATNLKKKKKNLSIFSRTLHRSSIQTLSKECLITKMLRNNNTNIPCCSAGGSEHDDHCSPDLNSRTYLYEHIEFIMAVFAWKEQKKKIRGERLFRTADEATDSAWDICSPRYFTVLLKWRGWL